VSGRLVIMGSGENAPAMIKLHRTLMDGLGDAPKYMIDTPYGFQVNADDLGAKYQQYFDESVGSKIELAKWRRKDASVVEHERTLSQLSQASWVLAGPGSPSYALDQWADTAVPAALADVVRRGGTLITGSAAAATIGAYAIPVYEIYKVGTDPFWLDGINLLGDLLGIRAVVVPHFDNKEGGRHDTSCCYIGMHRLEILESQITDGTGVLGVDEHTAVVIEIETGNVSVHGAGGLTLRQGGQTVFVANGETTTVEAMRTALNGAAAEPAAAIAPTTTSDLLTTFRAALAAGDAEAALIAALTTEDAVFATDAAANTDLRAMLVELADAAQSGLQDPRAILSPLVEVALNVRRVARENKDFAMSDLVRDSLTAAGIEVRDTPQGVQWDLIDRV
jgi:cyanophycinase-like exopeptidase